VLIAQRSLKEAHSCMRMRAAGSEKIADGSCGRIRAAGAHDADG
jgi:hypothetical protein